MSTINTVISKLLQGKFIDAIKEYRALTGCSLMEGKEAVEALRPYLDPSYQNPANGRPEPSSAKEEGIQQWVVTCRDPQTYEDLFSTYDSVDGALKQARALCDQNYNFVKISKVIAEAKRTYTIDL